MYLIDTHCHLDGDVFDADRDAVIARARAAGVAEMVAIGTGDGPPDLCAGIRLAEAYEFITATVGVHPHEAAKATDATWVELIALTKHPLVVAVGEIGLDYHYDFSPREVQRAAFVRQLQIAAAANLPITIHTREAWEDTIADLDAHWHPTAFCAGLAPGRETEGGDRPCGIFHCFSGGAREAEQALERGFLLSYSGIVTFPKSEEIREAVRVTPLDRILVETDAPYLAPVPWRGKRNEPAYVVKTAERVAELKGVTIEELAEATTRNWRRLRG
jgi:TatD DNase family protein